MSAGMKAAATRWTVGRALGTAGVVGAGVVGAAGAIGAGAAVMAKVRGLDVRSALDGEPRWHAVTILADDLGDGSAERPWPEPVRDLGDAVEVRTRPAPGGRGTELHARAVEPGDPGAEGTEPAPPAGGEIRAALRAARALVETGRVPQADEPGTTRPTLTSLPLQAAIRAGRTAGRL